VSKAGIKYYFLTLLIILSTALYGAKSPSRKFNEEELNKARREHNYGIFDQKFEGESLLDKISNTINEWIGVLLSPLQHVPAWVIYVIAFVILIILLAVLLRMNGNLSLFGNSGDDAVAGNPAYHENIHEIDFNKEIQEALKQGDYRKAVRLYYLLSLKLLSDKKLIDWQSHKTNREYIRELRATDLRMKLEEVTFMFELVWYGEVEMDQSVFDEIFKEMKGLQGAIKATVV